MEQKLENKRDLRDYLDRLGFTPDLLKQKAEEIMMEVNAVMNPYVIGERGETLQKYYAPSVERIRETYQQRQFKVQFFDAIRSLITDLRYE